MHILVAKFECMCPKGLAKYKKRQLAHGVIQRLRKFLKCSVEKVDEDMENGHRDFSVGATLVVRENKRGFENEWSHNVVDLIEKKGEIEVQDYLCAVVNMSDVIDEEALVTVH